jgi:copper homeostasis protein (lipoprotein)
LLLQLSYLFSLLGLLNLSACEPAADTPRIQPAATADVAHSSAVGSLQTRSFASAEVTLTLFDDFTYRLRHGMDDGSGEGSFSYDLGRWARAQDGDDRLRLNGGREAHTVFRFLAADLLQPLNNKGVELADAPLRLQTLVDRIAGPMRLTGMYRYMADAAVFSECLTGNSYPVLIEAGHLPLERAYLEQRAEPGAEMLASLDAEFVLRAPESGMPLREHLRITRFDKIWPAQQCP